MKNDKFLVKRLKSFVYALNGLKILITEEHNSRVHLFTAVGVIIASIALEISVLEWMAVVFAIGLVIAFEIFNSAIENMADFVCPERNEVIKKIKDLSAAGVLISAITALIIGLIVFLPKLSVILLKL